MEPCVLAIDLGASSGRVIAALTDGKTLRCHEIHRFANEPVRCCGSLYWDVLYLFNPVSYTHLDVYKRQIRCQSFLF